MDWITSINWPFPDGQAWLLVPWWLFTILRTSACGLVLRLNTSVCRIVMITFMLPSSQQVQRWSLKIAQQIIFPAAIARFHQHWWIIWFSPVVAMLCCLWKHPTELKCYVSSFFGDRVQFGSPLWWHFRHKPSITFPSGLESVSIRVLVVSTYALDHFDKLQRFGFASDPSPLVMVGSISCSRRRARDIGQHVLCSMSPSSEESYRTLDVPGFSSYRGRLLWPLWLQTFSYFLHIWRFSYEWLRMPCTSRIWRP